MGYRSVVTIAIYGPEEEMAPLLAAQRMLSDSPLAADRDYVKSYGFGMTLNKGPEIVRCHMILAQFESVKWYEGYPEVAAWEELISEASDNEALCTEFVRIGEETDDIQVRYTGDDCGYFVDVDRRIKVAVPYEVSDGG